MLDNSYRYILYIGFYIAIKNKIQAYRLVLKAQQKI